MGFFKNHLASIADIEIFPIISLLLFFTVFVFAFLWAFAAPKKYFDAASYLPFEDEATKPLNVNNDETTHS